MLELAGVMPQLKELRFNANELRTLVVPGATAPPPLLTLREVWLCLMRLCDRL